jgi:predicted nucleotidyltransferase
MDNISHTEKQMFIKSCQAVFDDQLIAMFEGDNYVRVSDFTFAYANHFVLVLERVNKSELDKMRVVLADFPTYFAHVLSKMELKQYPKHGLWQFAFRQPLVGSWPVSLEKIAPTSILAGVQHSIAQVSHIVRKHLLSPHSNWNTIWAVRFGAWALQLADLGIIRLWHCFDSRMYPESLQDVLDSTTTPTLKPAIKKTVHYIENWPQVREEFLQSPGKLHAFLLHLNELVEYYVQLVAEQFALPQPEYTNRQVAVGQTNSLFNNFADSFKQMMGDRLLLLLLSGSQARGEAERTSDVDTIAVLDTVDSTTLHQLKTLLAQFPDFSTYVLSLDGFRVYPAYRRYTFHYGCQYLTGRLALNSMIDTVDLSEGIRHTLITIAQVSREYYVRSSFSPRVIASIRWQAKMADFGCLRLLPLLNGESYLNSRDDVRKHFGKDENVLCLLDILANSSEWRNQLRCDLLRGDLCEVERFLLSVNRFVENQLYYIVGISE